jgi:hypothetical protein
MILTHSDRNATSRSTRAAHPTPVISNGAGRFFLPASLQRIGRPAQREPLPHRSRFFVSDEISLTLTFLRRLKLWRLDSGLYSRV